MVPKRVENNRIPDYFAQIVAEVHGTCRHTVQLVSVVANNTVANAGLTLELKLLGTNLHVSKGALPKQGTNIYRKIYYFTLASLKLAVVVHQQLGK